MRDLNQQQNQDTNIYIYGGTHCLNLAQLTTLSTTPDFSTCFRNLSVTLHADPNALGLGLGLGVWGQSVVVNPGRNQRRQVNPTEGRTYTFTFTCACTYIHNHIRMHIHPSIYPST